MKPFDRNYGSRYDKTTIYTSWSACSRHFDCVGLGNKRGMPPPSPWSPCITNLNGRREPQNHKLHEVDLVWVWSGWEVPIISYGTACPQWEPHSKSYDCAHPLLGMVWYGVVAIWLPAMVEGFQTLSIGIMMKCTKSEVVPSLNLIMVVWFVPR